jgi:hypothetical protein
VANYIDGAPQDYIPMIQPFRPDLNFYSNVLQTKQSQYDAAHKQINQYYGTLLNSPLTRDTNIERRDAFFKAIDNDIKKVSKLDLSQEQNVDAAKQVFRPLYEDKHIVKDMTWTKNLHNEMSRGENFRTCVDPEKCGGSYWEEGIRALQYKQEEFKNAVPDQALNFENVRYSPFVNLTEKAMKAAKASGLNVSVDSSKGGYIVTDSNGVLLSGTRENPGILPNYLYGLFKDDQKVMDVFKTQAYVSRKDFTKVNANTYGSEEAAEDHYLQNVLAPAVVQLTDQAEQSKKTYDSVENNLKLLSEKIRREGGYTQDSPEDSLMQAYKKVLESRPAAEAHNNLVMDTINSTSGLVDRDHLRQRADSIVAFKGFNDTIWNSASEYANGTAKHEKKADPFALEGVKFQHDIALKNMDYGIWKEKEDYKTARFEKMLLSQGLSPEEAKYFAATGTASPKEIKDFLARRGKPTGKDTESTIQTSGDFVKPGVVENQENFNTQKENLGAVSKVFLLNASEKFKTIYKSASSSPALKQQAFDILTEMYKGTNFDVSNYLENRVTADAINTLNPVSVLKAANVVSAQSTSPLASGWKDLKLVALKAAVDKEKQVLDGMGSEISQGAQKTLGNWLTEIQVKGGDDYPKVMKSMLEAGSLLDKNGQIRTKEEAAKAYANAASKYYSEDPKEILDAKSGVYFKNVSYKSRVQKALDDFDDDRYADLVKQYDKRYPKSGGHVFSSRPEFAFEGGAPTVQKSKTYQINPAKDLNEDTGYATSVLNEINNSKAVVIPNENYDVNAFVQDFQRDNEDRNKSLNNSSFTLTSQYVPELTDKKISFLPGGKDVTSPAKVIHTITPTPAYLISKLGRNKEKGGYDPAKNYSFQVEVPANADETGYVQKTTLTPAQMLMNIPGKELSYSDQEKGALTLHKDNNDNFYFSGTYKTFNPGTGQEEVLAVTPNQGYVPKELDADAAYAEMLGFLEDSYKELYVDRKAAFISKHRNNGSKEQQ